MYSSQGQFESAKVWRAWNWILGGFTAVASGLAGVLTFAADELQSVSGVLALSAAVTAAVHATLKPDKKAERAKNSANEYLALQSAARRFLSIDVPSDDAALLKSTLQGLCDRANAINSSSDVIPEFAYGRAKRNIGRGGQTYAVDAQ